MKVFYRPEQVAPTTSFSPSSLKPRLVVEDWLAIPELKVEVCGFDPVSTGQLSLAHDPKYVRGVLDGEIANGFGNTDALIAASLPFTSGSMVAAAVYAVQHREVVWSPTSGFHHAEYAEAQGFCTFNGLMVAALVLKKQGLVSRVAILDCDAHYGNGTDHIIKKLGLDWIVHKTQGAVFHSRKDAIGGKYERWLDEAITACLDCDLVLYQAGADPHVDDPLGGILTTEQMCERDRQVFERLGHIPGVVTLAGGYQSVEGETAAQRLEPVLALHRQTARLHSEILPIRTTSIAKPKKDHRASKS